MPLDRRTRATLRKAEFGFLGVMILTCRHTPFFCGQPCMAGCFGLRYCWRRGLRTSWLIVGIPNSPGGYGLSDCTGNNYPSERPRPGQEVYDFSIPTDRA